MVSFEGLNVESGESDEFKLSPLKRMSILNAELNESSELELELSKSKQLEILKFSRTALVACPDDKFDEVVSCIKPGLEQIGVDLSSKESTISGIDSVISKVEINEEGVLAIIGLSLLISTVLVVIGEILNALLRDVESVQKEIRSIIKELKVSEEPTPSHLNDDSFLNVKYSETIKLLNEYIKLNEKLVNAKKIDKKFLESMLKSYEKLGVKFDGSKLTTPKIIDTYEITVKEAGWEKNSSVLEALTLIDNFCDSFWKLKSIIKDVKSSDVGEVLSDDEKKSLKAGVKVIKAMFKFNFKVLKTIADNVGGLALERIS